MNEERAIPEKVAHACIVGALVRTRRAWSGGVHRAQVSRVVEQDGEPWAVVAGRSYRVSELEVIRSPVG